MRIRLEGALEQVELAVERCDRVKGLLGSSWRASAFGELELLEALRVSATGAAVAASRLEEMSQRESWDDGFGPERTLSRYRRAHAALLSRLDQLLPQANGAAGLSEKLEALIAETIPAGAGAPVAWCAVSPRWGVALLTSTALAIIPTALFAALAAHPPPPTLPAIAGALAGFVGSWWATSGRLELFGDRLRLRTRYFTREAALRTREVTAAERSTEVQVSGWRPVRVGSVAEARHFTAVAELLRHPGFEAPDGPPSPVMSLEAATEGASATETGALVLLRDSAWFMRDGQPTFDAASAPPRTLRGRSALALGAALGALSHAQQRKAMAKLAAAGRADAIASSEVQRAVVDGDLLHTARLRARFPRAMAERIDVWQRLLAGRDD